MPEVKRVVQPVEVNYVCDKCGHGMMQKTSEMNTETGEIEHKCVICDHLQIFKWASYPRVEYIADDESP